MARRSEIRAMPSCAGCVLAHAEHVTVVEAEPRGDADALLGEQRLERASSAADPPRRISIRIVPVYST